MGDSGSAGLFCFHQRTLRTPRIVLKGCGFSRALAPHVWRGPKGRLKVAQHEVLGQGPIGALVPKGTVETCATRKGGPNFVPGLKPQGSCRLVRKKVVGSPGGATRTLEDKPKSRACLRVESPPSSFRSAFDLIEESADCPMMAVNCTFGSILDGIELVQAMIIPVRRIVVRKELWDSNLVRHEGRIRHQRLLQPALNCVATQAIGIRKNN